MKLEFKKISDRDTWDNFVLEQERYTFVQSWKYINGAEALTGGEIERVGVYDSENLVGLLSLGKVFAKRGSYLRLRHNPILKKEYWNEDMLKQVNNYLKSTAKENGLNFIRIHPVMDNSELLEKVGYHYAPTHNLDSEKTLQLVFDGRNKEEVFASMRKNTRYYVRKSEKEGTKVVLDNNDFEAFNKIFRDTAERQHYRALPLRYYKKLFEELEPGKERNYYFADVAGKRVGVAFTIDFGKYRFYFEGGMYTEYSKHYPSYAIQWKAISDAVDKGLEIYDFWGGISPKEPDGSIKKDYPWAGINIFKAGFGGNEINMVHPHDLPINNKYWFTYFYERYEKWKRGY